ncbi:hypothetical protein Nhal_3138 [Nitrosococcus halophilus Nc 4]|uniref:Uncharacterized protein n=1 Tax=Nitrosococcus halophilus (strain Nc4) TaxID=472759 RepID=D5BZH6_NITHN|nr:DUF5995 family protein [Nitrosococcus halophilus]ADE16190.1 hypothetical protein Nhal_3138 [Nitrosococcus halophilus Nc 4]
MLPTTIDDVINELDRITDWAHRNRSRLGYFPALYREVTLNVKKGIEAGIFDSGERMERFDVIFANRYLKAFNNYQQGLPITQAWKVAFDAAQQWWPIVLQHLLLGSNAHINLDLGITAAETSPGEQLPDLKGDFDKINGILVSTVDGVEEELTQVWPLLGFLDRVVGEVDEKIAGFSLNKSRDRAWRVAEQLAPLSETERQQELDQLDKKVAMQGKIIQDPGLSGMTLLRLVRLGERGTVPEIIDILKDKSGKVSAWIQPS